MFPVWLMWEEEGICDLDLRHIPRWVRSQKGIWWASQGWKLVGSGFSHQYRHAVEAAFGQLIADCVYTSVGHPVSGQGKGQLRRLPRRHHFSAKEAGHLLGDAYGPATPDPPPSSPSTRTELCSPCSLGMMANRAGAALPMVIQVSHSGLSPRPSSVPLGPQVRLDKGVSETQQDPLFSLDPRVDGSDPSLRCLDPYLPLITLFFSSPLGRTTVTATVLFLKFSFMCSRFC